METSEDLSNNGDVEHLTARNRGQGDVGAGRDDFVGAGERVGLSHSAGRQAEKHEQVEGAEELQGPILQRTHFLADLP